ncbi:unnamed protein product [Durusdinium trenchii]|uniref:Uncharacterized protein n=1 Tax=Durusdinium trenchii TaxID=1381693 RepID=A0ABP0NEF2_9DINO
MVELLATFGAAAKELFDYNREMYQFDQGQRLDRELLRLEMQIKRFQLFREDIRDLVELTVAKMEMYHVVGALVLECTVIYYTEGRIRTSAPPFLLGLYWLSAAGTFTYVLLCVWFSMYASISSHSFGVRFLTRFVRLPIPGSQQMSAMNARLTDFERQGGNIMRIPFMQGVPQWQQRRRDAGKNPSSSTGQGEGDEEYLTAVVKPGEMKQQDLLESGVAGYADDEGGLQKAAVNLPGKHIKLFRELQAKWQCYDAYARVCMSFGVNHICMTMSYYMIGLTVLEYRSPSIMFALVTVFQATNLALAWLDVAGLKRKTTTLLEFIGAVPPFLTCFCMAWAPHQEEGRGQFDPAHEFPYACISFFITVVWLEGLLHLAWPSEDLAMLPKRFRSVLFLDVFGMADDVKAGEETAGQPLVEISREEAEAADEAVSLAEAAVRRWNALPMGTEEAQKHQAEIHRLHAQALMWRKVLNGEAAKRAQARGDIHELDLLEPDLRRWNQLTEEEKEEDPFADSLLGPFQNAQGEVYYYHLESMQFVWKPEEQGVLSLTQVSTLVKDAERTVTDLFHGREDLMQSDDSDMEVTTRTVIVESCFYVLRGCSKRRRPMERERRLPWRALLSVTRVSQLSWLFLGLSILGQNTGVLPKFDLLVLKSKEEEEKTKEEEEHGEAGERRMQALGSSGSSRSSQWDFEVLNVSAWPKGITSTMSCLPTQGGHVYMTTDGSTSVWSAPILVGQALSFQAAGVLVSPAATAMLCPRDQEFIPCFLEVVENGFKLQLQEEIVKVPAPLMPSVGSLRKITGAAMRCKILALGHEVSGFEWCLLLAGWDGRRLPVSVLALPHSDNPGVLTALPLFDVLANMAPESCTSAEVASLGMEASGILWVLWSNGRLDAFNLPVIDLDIEEPPVKRHKAGAAPKPRPAVDAPKPQSHAAMQRPVCSALNPIAKGVRRRPMSDATEVLVPSSKARSQPAAKAAASKLREALPADAPAGAKSRPEVDAGFTQPAAKAAASKPCGAAPLHAPAGVTRRPDVGMEFTQPAAEAAPKPCGLAAVDAPAGPTSRPEVSASSVASASNAPAFSASCAAEVEPKDGELEDDWYNWMDRRLRAACAEPMRGSDKAHAKIFFESAFKVPAKEAVPEQLREEPKIMWQDEDLAVVFKPSGWSADPNPQGVNPAWARLRPSDRQREVTKLLTQEADAPLQGWLLLQFGHETMSDACRSQEIDRGIVHRLDAKTSGPLLIGKTHQGYVHARGEVLRGLFKDYLVLVHGRLPSERGECNANLDTSSFKENGRVRLDPAGLQCSTLWEVLVEYESAEGEKQRLSIHESTCALPSSKPLRVLSPSLPPGNVEDSPDESPPWSPGQSDSGGYLVWFPFSTAWKQPPFCAQGADRVF